MEIERLSLVNYRSARQADIVFAPGVNLLLGANAQGKTNAVEAIACCSLGKSFRGVRDRELIAHGEQTAEISLDYRDREREQNLRLRLSDSSPRKMEKNGVTLRRTADFVGNLHCVLFCPEHLGLVKGSPEDRRNFLDEAISQLRPGYLSAVSEYSLLLRQRAAVLKDEERTKEEKLPLLDALTEQISKPYARIVRTREGYCSLLAREAQRILADMTEGAEKLEIAYRTDIPFTREETAETVAARYYETCMERADIDFDAGFTTRGAHRDDLEFTLNGYPAKTTASQGQCRSAALAMKLAEGVLSALAAKEPPVYLLDDVLSELDGGRQKYLLGAAGKHGQVIITSCSEAAFEENVNVIRVSGGTYTQEGSPCG